MFLIKAVWMAPVNEMLFFWAWISIKNDQSLSVDTEGRAPIKIVTRKVS